MQYSLAAAFAQFHAENPQVYAELRKLSFDLKRRGRERYGIKALFEVLRFHRAMTTNDPDFKLNNNYHAFYARLLMEQEPGLKGFFETREHRGHVHMGGNHHGVADIYP